LRLRPRLRLALPEWGYTALSRHRDEARSTSLPPRSSQSGPEPLSQCDVPLHVARMLTDSPRRTTGPAPSGSRSRPIWPQTDFEPRHRTRPVTVQLDAEGPRGLIRSELMTIREVAELLAVSISTVCEWGRNGTLPRVRARPPRALDPRPTSKPDPRGRGRNLAAHHAQPVSCAPGALIDAVWSRTQSIHRSLPALKRQKPPGERRLLDSGGPLRFQR
jgi:hypothetical protein